MLEVFIVIVMLILSGYLVIKNYNPILVLISSGLILLFLAVLLGHPLYKDGEGSGLIFFDIFLKFKDIIVRQVETAGLILMILFGYSGYMNKIGANQIAVNILMRPLKNIKSGKLFIPAVLLMGNLMSLVVPSASSLAIILLAVLYPMLQGIGISSLTAAGVIAMTATIMPTPLGADNILAAKTLKMDLLDYVAYHAKISIPTLIILAIVHSFWQNYCDKKEGKDAFIKIDDEKLKTEEEKNLPQIYALLPVLPLFLIIITGILAIFNKSVKMDVFVLTFISFVIAMLFELFRTKSLKKTLLEGTELFSGMGTGFSRVVMLVAAGSLFTTGIKTLGVIDILLASTTATKSAGIFTTLIFSASTALFSVLSGSGLAMFYAVIELVPGIAAKSGINGMMISLPMQMIANLGRTISPVSAVIMIVSSTVGVSPVRILKRTGVPTIIGIILVVILSIFILPG